MEPMSRSLQALKLQQKDIQLHLQQLQFQEALQAFEARVGTRMEDIQVVTLWHTHSHTHSHTQPAANEACGGSCRSYASKHAHTATRCTADHAASGHSLKVAGRGVGGASR
jgi:hypothetical protein